MFKLIRYYVLLLVLIFPCISKAADNSSNFFKEAENYTVRIYGSTVVALETSERGSWTGSGFIVSIDKKQGIAFVATNKHVIGTGISSIQVSFKDGERFQATPIYIDPVYDFGMLKFNLNEAGVPKNINEAGLGNSNEIKVGDSVGTFGNPKSFEYCATEGIISSVTNNPGYEGAFFQTDASINPGNSGGPLISMKNGKVIAINTAVTSNSEGIGWSLAINQLKPLIDQVVKGETSYAGHMGWLGVVMEEINVDRAQEDFGAGFNENIPRKALLITSVLKGGPADKSGIKPGDIILSLNKKMPSDYADFLSLMRTLGNKNCEILLCRLGKDMTLNIDIIDRGDLRPKDYVTFAGMVVQQNTPSIFEAYYSWSSQECVYVCDVLEGSSAEAWGAYKHPLGGVLVGLKYYPVKSLDDFWNAIKNVKPGESVELFYGTPTYGYICKIVYYDESESPKREQVK